MWISNNKTRYYWLGGGGNQELLFHGYIVSVLQDEKVLESYCTTKWMYTTLLNCTLESGWDGKLHVTCFFFSKPQLVIENKKHNNYYCSDYLEHLEASGFSLEPMDSAGFSQQPWQVDAIIATSHPWGNMAAEGKLAFQAHPTTKRGAGFTPSQSDSKAVASPTHLWPLHSFTSSVVSPKEEKSWDSYPRI